MSVEEGIEKHRKGDMAGAEAAYRAAVNEDPSDHRAQHLLAVALIDRGALDEALTHADQAIELDDSQGSYFQTLSIIQHRRGNLGGALSNMDRAVQLDPNLPQGHNTLGYLQMVAGDLDAAESTLKIATRLNSEDAGAVTNLGMVYLAREQLADARTEMNRALAIDETFLPARAGLGEVFLTEGANGFAAECFRRCVESKPESIRFQALLATALARNGDVEEARERIEGAMDKTPDQPDLLSAAGEVALVERKPRLASNYLQQSLMLRRGHTHTLALLAEAHAMLEDHPSVVRLLERLVERPRLRPGMVAMLARSEAAIGRVETAEQRLRQALKDNAESVDETHALIQILATDGRADDALALIEAAPEIVATHSRIMIAKARLLLAAGERDQAGDVLDSIIRPGTLRSELRFLQGLKAWQDDNTAEANAIFSELGEEVDVPALDLPEPTTVTWPGTAPDDNRGEPLLLAGLPGSGIRAIAQALDTLENVDVLDDRFGSDPRNDFIRDRKTAIGSDDEDQLRRIRRRYWTTLEHHRDKRVPGVAAVDWIPLPLLDIPRISAVFPGATIGIVTRPDDDIVLHGQALGWRDGQRTTIDTARALGAMIKQAQAAGVDIRLIDFDEVRAGKTQSLEDFIAARDVKITNIDVPLATELKDPDGLDRYLN